ncbi:MAG: sigma 54-interacting transcriptional regulator, partial [Clostridiales bacterium]
LFAQSIHNYSPNFQEPFVAINCGAIPENLIESTLFGSVKGAYTGAENQEGLFLSAKNGTLFLDEVNSMPPSMQAKLLRVLQEKKVRPVGSNKEYPIDCRILSSCNANPEEALRDKVFRSDLYYRLAIMRIDIPPLRKRKDDISLLAYFFAEKYAVSYRKIFAGFDDDFLKFILDYSWPGNVRELEFTIEGCIALLNEKETQIMIKHLPVNLINKTMNTKKAYASLSEFGLPETLLQYEKSIIIHALEKNKGNVTQTAKELNIQRQNLQQRMKKLDISSIRI